MAFSVIGAYNDHVECEICLEPWHDPVEIEPCEHLYCRQCIAQCWQCPHCRTEITGKHVPSPVLVRIAARVAIRCDLCQWTGTRAEQSEHLTACPRGLGLAAGAFGGSSGGAACEAPPRVRKERATLTTTTTPTEPVHADLRRPWRSYALSESAYLRSLEAFNASASPPPPTTASGAAREIASVEAFAGFLTATGLFGTTGVTPRDATIFFSEADLNRTGSVPLHFAISFVGLNHPQQPSRTRHSYRYDADAEEEEEAEAVDIGGGMVGFGKQPRITRDIAPAPDVSAIGAAPPRHGQHGPGAAASSTEDYGLGGTDFSIGDVDTGLGAHVLGAF